MDFVKSCAIDKRINQNLVTGKGKFHPITCHEGTEMLEIHSSALSLTSVLDGVGGQHHPSASLPPGINRCS